MTHEEREAEAQRLMDLLTGAHQMVVLVTECGELKSAGVVDDDDDDDELAPWWAACPTCGERREDYLTLDEDDDPTEAWTGLMYSTCYSCKTVYGFEYSRLDC
jgi:hypothetical protein